MSVICGKHQSEPPCGHCLESKLAQAREEIEKLKIIDKYRTSPTPWLVERLLKLERVQVAAEVHSHHGRAKPPNCPLCNAIAALRETEER